MVPAPVTLANVIGWIESRNNPFAMRFEPRVFSRTQKELDILLRIVNANGCTHDTAEVIYSTSWGEYQLMGFNLYSSPLNFQHSIGDYLTESDFQLQTFNQFVAYKNLAMETPQTLLDTTNALRFARLYNGGSQYAQEIAASLQHFGVTA